MWVNVVLETPAAFFGAAEPSRRCDGSQLTCKPSSRSTSFFIAVLAVVVAGAFLVLVPGCGNSVNALSIDGGGASTGTGGDGDRRSGGTGGGKIPVGQTQCSDGIDNDGDGKIDYADPECVGAARQRRELVRDRHPGRQRRRLQAGLLLRRQLGHGRRRLRVAAQVRSDEHERAVPVRPGVRPVSTRTSARCRRRSRRAASTTARSWSRTAATASAAASVPGAPTPIRLVATCTAEGLRQSRRSARACTQVTQCMTPCGHCDYCIGKDTLPADCTPDPTAARPTPARPATRPAGSTASIRRMCPTDTGCVTGCCRPIVP